jgi:hypothetical protein
VLRLLRRLRDAWRYLWAGAQLSDRDGLASPNPYLSQAPTSGDIDADSRGRGKISD